MSKRLIRAKFVRRRRRWPPGSSGSRRRSVSAKTACLDAADAVAARLCAKAGPAAGSDFSGRVRLRQRQGRVGVAELQRQPGPRADVVAFPGQPRMAVRLRARGTRRSAASSRPPGTPPGRCRTGSGVGAGVGGAGLDPQDHVHPLLRRELRVVVAAVDAAPAAGWPSCRSSRGGRLP